MMEAQNSREAVVGTNLRPDTAEEWPLWFKVGQKVVCVLAGLLCGALGLLVAISIHATCIVAGIIQIFIGLLVLVLEAPCCCSYLDCIDKISKFSSSRPPYQKAILYCVLPIFPVALCQAISSIVGCLVMIFAGLSYVYMAIGKKASREAMLQYARSENSSQPIASGDKSGLVGNAQPMAFSATSANQIV